jgi:sulfatase maturation enzyme AslB (radical SAM superfamily)
MPLPSLYHRLRLFYKHPLYVGHLLSKKAALRRRYACVAGRPGKDDQVPLPLVYKFILTWKCNLRCTMCMLWGDRGRRREITGASPDELDWRLIEKIFNQAKNTEHSFIFSGGEPLLYSRFADVAELLKARKRFATICTNGMLLDTFDPETLSNPYLVFLISLDGPQQENDTLRGEGTYKKIVSNIAYLKSLPHPPYIGIQFTLRPENVARIYEFCKQMATLGVDWILLNPCWFVSPQEALEYERLLSRQFGVMPEAHRGYPRDYPIDKEEFVRQCDRINRAQWPMQISCYFKKPQDIYPYVDCSPVLADGAPCYKQWVRLDILPSGKTSPCIQFPDLVFGDLNAQDINQVWNGRDYFRFRRYIRKRMLPVCMKCNNVYLYDPVRKHL